MTSKRKKIPVFRVLDEYNKPSRHIDRKKQEKTKPKKYKGEDADE